MTTTHQYEDDRSTSSYRDHANDVEVVDNNDASSSSVITKNGNGSSSETNFPVKLHYMLSDMEADGLDHIVSWQPHGRAFIVHKPKEFVSQVLLLWFRQSKFSSFQRQLNLYGFKRITAGPDKGAHYHELFLRGKRYLAHRIPRIKIKGQGARKPAQPSQEPNFYQMPYLPATLSPSTTASNTFTTRTTTASSVVDPRSLVTYSRMHNNNNHHANASDESVVLAAHRWMMGNNNHGTTTTPSSTYPHQSSSLGHPVSFFLPSTTTTTSLDHVLMQQQQQHPMALLNYALAPPPAILSTLVKEHTDAAALLQQLRRR